MLFDKEGILNIDELVAQRPTFRKIMEDQIVTDDELTNQANLVVNLLKKLLPIPLPAKLTGIRTITPLLRQEENFVPNVVNRCLLKLSFVADAELNCIFRKALTVG